MIIGGYHEKIKLKQKKILQGPLLNKIKLSAVGVIESPCPCKARICP
jgi:hypothetical protein